MATGACCCCCCLAAVSSFPRGDSPQMATLERQLLLEQLRVTLHSHASGDFSHRIQAAAVTAGAEPTAPTEQSISMYPSTACCHSCTGRESRAAAKLLKSVALRSTVKNAKAAAAAGPVGEACTEESPLAESLHARSAVPSPDGWRARCNSAAHWPMSCYRQQGQQRSLAENDRGTRSSAAQASPSRKDWADVPRGSQLQSPPPGDHC